MLINKKIIILSVIFLSQQLLCAEHKPVDLYTLNKAVLAMPSGLEGKTLRLECYTDLMSNGLKGTDIEVGFCLSRYKQTHLDPTAFLKRYVEGTMNELNTNKEEFNIDAFKYVNIDCDYVVDGLSEGILTSFYPRENPISLQKYARDYCYNLKTQ